MHYPQREDNNIMLTICCPNPPFAPPFRSFYVWSLSPYIHIFGFLQKLFIGLCIVLTQEGHHAPTRDLLGDTRLGRDLGAFSYCRTFTFLDFSKKCSSADFDGWHLRNPTRKIVACGLRPTTIRVLANPQDCGLLASPNRVFIEVNFVLERVG